MEDGRWQVKRKKKKMVTKEEVMEDDASYWDIISEELRMKLLEARDLLYKVDRRKRWVSVHEEMSHLPHCLQHGTVRCHVNLLDLFLVSCR